MGSALRLLRPPVWGRPSGAPAQAGVRAGPGRGESDGGRKVKVKLGVHARVPRPALPLRRALGGGLQAQLNFRPGEPGLLGRWAHSRSPARRVQPAGRYYGGGQVARGYRSRQPRRA
eukprot:2292279-Pyramimonas_sp.AAC.2